MPNILDEIISNKKLDIQSRQTSLTLDELKKKITSGDGSFLRALQKPGLNIIAEIKPKSPSAGDLRIDINVNEIVPVYNKYASAISVLTDEKFFGGGFELLSEVSKLSPLPILCKDFILDSYQCYLARHYGAQAVLLIVKILDQEELEILYKQINELAMTAVIEVQNKMELERAMALQPAPEVILINNRNLEDFQINFKTTKQLSPLIEGQTVVISASGLQSKSDIEELIPFCSNFLVGSQFMRSANLKNAFEELIDIRLPSASSAGRQGGNS
jgi:indole-3-glycerol phosphate synthase / phosphoribosylanthranilate isomerase